jgi:hypothetical protein
VQVGEVVEVVVGAGGGGCNLGEVWVWVDMACITKCMGYSDLVLLHITTLLL